MSSISKSIIDNNNNSLGDCPIAITASGTVRGFYEDGVAKYFGIPFAKPPTGNLRFLPPQDSQPWDGILNCKRKKPAAIQLVGASGDREYSEDCLYLNIWAPEDAQKKKNLPVLVLVHGGAFMQGSPNMVTFDGTSFAKDGVIQVNLAYRLNALGFAAFEEIEDEYGYLGNAGLLDLVQGLDWVHENIENFGGDADNVTIWGESAGSMLISDLMISKETKGLFSRVIMQSGTTQAQHVLAAHGNGVREKAIAATKRLMDVVGAETLEDMRQIDPMEFAENAVFSFNMTKQNPQYFFPIFDGKLIPLNPVDAVNAGKLNHVDLLTGFNADEGTVFIPPNSTKDDYLNYMRRCFGSDAGALEKRFPVDVKHSMIQRLRHYVKLHLACGSQTFADVLTAKGKNVFMYEITYATKKLREKGMGTFHGMELPFVFDTLPSDMQDDDSILVKDQIHKRWLGFIKNGDPNSQCDFSVEWPKYSTEEKKMIVLDTEQHLDTWPFAEDLEFLINNTNYPFLK